MDKRARTPSMDGFRWFTTAPAPRRAGNGWCVRDALCELYGWAPGSKNWRTFVVEYPEGKDIERLVQHLGLVWLDRQKVGEDSTLQDHPGVAFYDLDLYQVSHCVF